jgi:hypothetical protein
MRDIQRPFYRNVSYTFIGPRGRKIDLSREEVRLFDRYKGKTLHESEIWLDLIELPSPTGKRTMWDFFRYKRTIFQKLDIMRETRTIDDPILEMQIRMRLEDWKKKHEESK